MSTSEAYTRLTGELNELRRDWRRQKLTEGAVLAATVMAAALVVVIAADNLLRLGSGGRWLMSLLFWGTLAAGIVRLIVRRWLEERREDFFAAMVEHKHPELRNQLINGLQLGRGNHYGSPRLIEAIVTDAAKSTADLEMRDSLDGRHVKRAALLLGAALAVVAVYAFAASTPRFANGLARVLLPMADIAPYTATHIAEVKPGNTRVPEGAPITVETRVNGAIPATARLFRRSDGQSWRAVDMQPGQTTRDPLRTFRFTVLQASKSFDF